MEIKYADLGGRIICCKLDNVFIVDIKYQREFEKYMLLFKVEGLDSLIEELKIQIGV